MYNNNGINRRYSEGDKLKVLAERSTVTCNKIELGRFYAITKRHFA